MTTYGTNGNFYNNGKENQQSFSTLKNIGCTQFPTTDRFDKLNIDGTMCLFERPPLNQLTQRSLKRHPNNTRM